MLQSSHARTWMDLGLAACGFAVWLALSSCDGSATQTTTGKGIQGMLVDSQGHPVSGATIKARPAAYGPIRFGADLDTAQAVTVRTDERGHYAIPDLEVGIYNLFGANPANQATVLIPRVKYLEQAADLGTDTLKAPGVIVGKVRVDDGMPPLAFCYLEGSDYAAISDSSGRFILPGLAEGEYRLNYFANGYALAIDSVKVRSGDTTILLERTLARDLSLQPPAPQGVSAAYDSVYASVRLSWNPVRVADFKEYLIEYEDTPDYAPVYYAHTQTVTDTAYEDVLTEYFGLYGVHSAPFTRTYWVRAKDSEGNLSPRQSPPIKINIGDPAIFKTEFSLHAILDSAGGSMCQDTLAFALDVASSPDSLVRIQWRAMAYFRNSDSAGNGHGWTTLYDSIGVSIGAPRKDTLYFGQQTFAVLGAWGSEIRYDSLLVTAALANHGGLIHMITIPVAVDSSACFRALPAREKSNGKVPF